MTTPSGKTFTAVNFVYRLVKHANARPVLFLVDRSNLGRDWPTLLDELNTELVA